MEIADTAPVDTAGPGPKWFVPVILAIAVIGLLVALGSFGGAGTVTATTGSSPPSTLFVDPLETAVAVVEEFAAAWSADDVAAVKDLIGEDWVSISLPGFADPSFRPGDGRDALENGLAFIVPMTDLNLGPCEVDVATPSSKSEAVVRCDDAVLSGPYLEAVRRDAYENLLPEGGVSGEETKPGMWFGINDGLIIALDDGDPHRHAPEAYCVWVEETHPELAAGLFDLSCRPLAAVDSIAAHQDLAASYLAARTPLPNYERLAGRLSAANVNRLIVTHNAGDAAGTRAFFSETVTADGFPGYAGGAADDLGGFLAWSSRMYQIEPGWCRVEVPGDRLTVTCPDLMIRGPLVDRSDPLPEPTRFTVLYGTVVEVAALDEEQVDAETTCHRLRRLRPLTAANTFTGECTPIYTADAAEVLLTVLEGGYTAEG